jgi:hypothetical protein
MFRVIGPLHFGNLGTRPGAPETRVAEGPEVRHNSEIGQKPWPLEASGLPKPLVPRRWPMSGLGPTAGSRWGRP